jgi:hypothetical protein
MNTLNLFLNKFKENFVARSEDHRAVFHRHVTVACLLEKQERKSFHPQATKKLLLAVTGYYTAYYHQNSEMIHLSMHNKTSLSELKFAIILDDIIEQRPLL